ncbi:ent-kaurenoic acid oxidase 2-like [Prosopis cineraria]|uniref:ent-kaurenoic acid oxidase 2-like n=1 Tax=Prosopis cineraria TaxID=364024 RepID=UPI00240EB35C|nr:ent-kaurenoic acid oxidase 2-like [Prosopis cineraria]
MIDGLMNAEDENGNKLDDEQVIDIMLMYLNASHESSGHITMWATVYLQQHPKCFQRAKVIDETMCLVTFSLTVFREPKSDVNINGYLVPKGWRALAWFRTIHYDLKIYPNPIEFNPSRWDKFMPKATEFMPFGVGSRLCPGNELAKLEIIVFLHHFLLSYRLECLNPKSPVMYLPYARPIDNCVARIHKVSKA